MADNTTTSAPAAGTDTVQDSRPNVIEVDSVRKTFTVHKDKSLKERIVNAARSRKHAERFTALDDISFEVKAGESIGLIGANGSGKSTLLKTIGGILTPDDGEVRVRGRIAALLELGAGFHPDLTGRENIYLNASMLGLSDEEIDSKLDSIIEFSGIADFIDTQVKFYSSGMYVRLAFAVAIHSDPDILLVDEVLAVGDEPFQRKCMDKIRQFRAEGRSIILVSHSAAQIVEVTDRAVVLDHGKVIGIDKSREAMTLLRGLYEEQIVADIESLASDDAETKDEEQKIELCRIVDANVDTSLAKDAKGRPYFPSGDDLTVEISLESDGPVENHGFIIGMWSAENHLVFGTSTHQIGSERLPRFNGKQTFAVTLPAFQLGPGDYTINVAIVERTMVEIARKNRAVAFTVRATDTTNGYINTEPEIEIR